jgi:hypothetical protein
MDAAADGASSDGSAGMLAPKPPAGAQLCGSGTFTATEAVVECQKGATFFSAADTSSLCSQVTMASGEWKAWCTDKTAYVWTRFNGVNVTSPCTEWYMKPMFQAGKAAGDTGNDMLHGFSGDPSTSIYAGAPMDAMVFITADREPGKQVTASLYLAATPGLSPSCKNVPLATTFMLGAPVSFTAN